MRGKGKAAQPRSAYFTAAAQSIELSAVPAPAERALPPLASSRRTARAVRGQVLTTVRPRETLAQLVPISWLVGLAPPQLADPAHLNTGLTRRGDSLDPDTSQARKPLLPLEGADGPEGTRESSPRFLNMT